MALTNYTPRYNYADYSQWQGDWELWSGCPVAMSPSPGMAHQIVVGRICRAVSTALEEAACKRCIAIPEIDWRISDDTLLRPDLSVVCGHPIEAFLSKTPSLVAEVLSDSTRQRDLLYKRELYEKLGVAIYLIADPVSASVICLELNDGAYVEAERQNFALSKDCEITLSMSRLFDDLNSHS